MTILTYSISEKNLIVMLAIKNRALKTVKDELSANKNDNSNIKKNDLDIFQIFQTRNMIERNFNNIKRYLDIYSEIDFITQVVAVVNTVKEYTYYKQTKRRKKVVRKW